MDIMGLPSKLRAFAIRTTVRILDDATALPMNRQDKVTAARHGRARLFFQSARVSAQNFVSEVSIVHQDGTHATVLTSSDGLSQLWRFS
jgi:hypothetical protein